MEIERDNDVVVEEELQEDAEEILDAGAYQDRTMDPERRGIERLREGHIKFRKEKETAIKLKWNYTKVIIRYPVTTSVVCMCKDSHCKAKMCVGKFGMCGHGQISCPHWKAFRSEDVGR